MSFNDWQKENTATIKQPEPANSGFSQWQTQNNSSSNQLPFSPVSYDPDEIQSQSKQAMNMATKEGISLSQAEKINNINSQKPPSLFQTMKSAVRSSTRQGGTFGPSAPPKYQQDPEYQKQVSFYYNSMVGDYKQPYEQRTITQEGFSLTGFSNPMNLTSWISRKYGTGDISAFLDAREQFVQSLSWTDGNKWQNLAVDFEKTILELKGMPAKTATGTFGLHTLLQAPNAAETRQDWYDFVKSRGFEGAKSAAIGKLYDALGGVENPYWRRGGGAIVGGGAAAAEGGDLGNIIFGLSQGAIFTPRTGESVKSPAKQTPTGEITEGASHAEIPTGGKEGFTIVNTLSDGTSQDRFVDRKQATKIAKEAGQTDESVKELHSEDLKVSPESLSPEKARMKGMAAIPKPVTEFAEQDVIPAAKAFFNDAKTTIEDIQSTFTPAALKDAKEVKTEFRGGLGEMEAASKRAENNLIAAKKYFGKKGEIDNYDFISRMERGEQQPNVAEENFSKTIRTLLDNQQQALAEAGKLHDFIDYYFPRIVDTTGTEGERLKSYLGQFKTKKPLAGTKKFLKQRARTAEGELAYPTVNDLRHQGFKLISDNPIDIVLAHTYDVNKLLMTDKLMKKWKKTGETKFVKAGQLPPEDWIKIDDPAGKVMQWSEKEKGFIIRGNYYMPKDSARIINNYLSRGLWGKGWYEMLREPGNALNQLQLGLSAFHFSFVSIDSMTSQFSLGLQKIFTGLAHPVKEGIFIAEGVKNLAESIPIYNQVQTYRRGAAIHREYLKNPADQNPILKPYIEAIEKANAAIAEDSYYQNKEFGLNGMVNAWKKGNPIGSLLRLPGAILDVVRKPLMNKYVPEIKNGAFFNQADFILKQAAAESWSQQKTNARLQEASDSIDNRMGQLKYDNLFWNKTIKDLGLVSTRSLGWNLGTIRELGGGILDTQKIITEGRLTPRTAYVLALPIITGTLGALTQLIYAGKRPGEDGEPIWKDLFFPRTGRKMPDGNWERISIPSYMKDVAAYAYHPLNTLTHKAHPLASAMYQMFTNQDFYGTQIRNPDDPLVKQIEQEIAYSTTTLEPFSVRNALQFANQGGHSKGEDVGAFFGAVPAAKYITNTSLQSALQEQISNRIKITQTKEQRARTDKTNKYANELRAAKYNNKKEDYDASLKQMFEDKKNGSLSDDDIRKVAIYLKTDKTQRLGREATAQELVALWPKATADEKKQLDGILATKLDNLRKNHPDEYKQLLPEIRKNVFGK
jgi:hypothetical protein